MVHERRKPEPDEAFDDLADVDLSKLELGDIDLDAGETRRFWRALGLASLLALGVFVAWAPTTEWFQQVGSGGGASFALAGLAVVVGVLVGRWLSTQAEAARAPAPPRTRLPRPPWLKWVAVTVVAIMATAVLVVRLASEGDGDDGLGFTLGAVGFTAGVGGAIWIAQRFDEIEQRAAARRGTVHRPAPPDRPGSR